MKSKVFSQTPSRLNILIRLLPSQQIVLVYLKGNLRKLNLISYTIKEKLGNLLLVFKQECLLVVSEICYTNQEQIEVIMTARCLFIAYYVVVRNFGIRSGRKLQSQMVITLLSVSFCDMEGKNIFNYVCYVLTYYIRGVNLNCITPKGE